MGTCEMAAHGRTLVLTVLIIAIALHRASDQRYHQ